MALQILYFVPHNLLQPARSFAAISQKLLVSPVLKKLVFANSPEEVHLHAHIVLPVCLLAGGSVACCHMQVAFWKSR